MTLEKIISGGQTSVDHGALDAALVCRLVRQCLCDTLLARLTGHLIEMHRNPGVEFTATKPGFNGIGLVDGVDRSG